MVAGHEFWKMGYHKACGCFKQRLPSMSVLEGMMPLAQELRDQHEVMLEMQLVRGIGAVTTETEQVHSFPTSAWVKIIERYFDLWGKGGAFDSEAPSSTAKSPQSTAKSLQRRKRGKRLCHLTVTASVTASVINRVIASELAAQY